MKKHRRLSLLCAIFFGWSCIPSIRPTVFLLFRWLCYYSVLVACMSFFYNGSPHCTSIQVRGGGDRRDAGPQPVAGGFFRYPQVLGLRHASPVPKVHLVVLTVWIAEFYARESLQYCTLKNRLYSSVYPHVLIHRSCDLIFIKAKHVHLIQILGSIGIFFHLCVRGLVDTFPG